MEPIELSIPEYTVELWDINDVFVADVTALISTSLRILLPLNDVDEVSFSLDLVQFEKLCQSIGARPINILEPYRTDVKIKRNGEYLVGAHVVQTNVNFNKENTNTLEVQCTGYLNHLKDRYLSAHYSKMTYAQIAQQSIIDTQAAFNLIHNGDFYDGVGGWQYINSGFVIWDSTTGHTANGSLFCSIDTGPNTFGGARWQHAMQAGLEYTLSYWIKPVSGGASTYINSGGADMNLTAITDDVNWTYVTHTWTQAVDSSFVDINMDTNTNFWLDDVWLSDNIDSAANRNFGITMGVDEASSLQQSDRVRNYDLQNVKDAVINLTKLEEDNFDFSFDANKVFNIYARKGSDKAHVELVYPQNIESLKATRSALKLSNKIIGLGSGIGDERLETSVLDYVSGTTYRVRERTEMFNSVEFISTLIENSIGALDEFKELDDNIDVALPAGVLDLNDVVVGDAVYVRVDQPESEVVQTENNLISNPTFETDISGFTASGYQLSFDGVDDYITLPYKATNSLTIQMRARFTTATQNLVSYMSTLIRTGTNDLTWWPAVALTATSLSAPNIGDGRYHDIVLTHSGTTTTLYIDGVQTDQKTTGTLDTVNYSNFIANYFGTSNFSGSIKLFRLWTEALTSTEAVNAYRGVSIPKSDSLHIEYLLEQGTGTVATNTGLSTDGTITGATWIDDRPTILHSKDFAETGNGSLLSTHNMVTNPSFETDITGWTAYSGATLAHDTTNSYIGKGSLMATSASAVGGGGFSGYANQNVTVVSGKTYQFSAYVRSDTLGSTNAGNIYVGSGTTNINEYFTITSEWKYVSLTFTADGTTAGCYLRTTDLDYVAYWDNVQLREVSEVPMWGSKYQMTDLVVGKSYDLSFYVKQDDSTDYVGVLLPNKTQKSIQASDSWQLVTLSFSAVSPTQDMYLINFTGSNPFYVDNVNVPYTKIEPIKRASYVDYVNGLYRIIKIDLDVTLEFDENVRLELEKWD